MPASAGTPEAAPETTPRPDTAAHDRWQRQTDLPLLVLALASIPLLVLEANSNETIRNSALFANWVIWALFAIDLVVRLFLTNRPVLPYLKTYWFDVVIVVVAILPLFQPLRALRSARILRLARSLRVVGLLIRFWRSADRVWSGFQGRLVGVAVIVILGAGAVGIWTVERHQDGPIRSFDDAIWWAFTTVTTVGYGDMYPVTPEGRGIAIFLMLAGIAVFGVVSANLAAIFLKSSDEEEEADRDELLAAVRELTDRVDALNRRLDERD